MKGDRPEGMDDGSRGGADQTERGFVVEVNKLKDGNKMSFDIMLDNFRERFTTNEGLDKNGVPLNSYEHMIAIDDDGYAHTLLHGNEGSVAYNLNDVNGKMVLHNHPNDATFSRADLRGLKESNITGIVASGATGDYIFRVKKGFKYSDFDKALTKSPITDRVPKGYTLSDINKFTINWLRHNQKKYGYTFEYRKRNS